MVTHRDWPFRLVKLWESGRHQLFVPKGKPRSRTNLQDNKLTMCNVSINVEEEAGEREGLRPHPLDLDE